MKWLRLKQKTLIEKIQEYAIMDTESREKEMKKIKLLRIIGLALGIVSFIWFLAPYAVAGVLNIGNITGMGSGFGKNCRMVVPNLLCKRVICDISRMDIRLNGDKCIQKPV